MNKISSTIGKIASNKAVQLSGQLAQAHPNPIVSGSATFASAILGYVAQSYQEDQQQAANEYLFELDRRLNNLDQTKVDEEYLYSRDGRRLIARIMRLVYRDSRKEKIIAASHLTKKLITANRMSIDEKELFVETLDSINVLQFSILQYVTIQMWQRIDRPHKGFDWGKIATKYQDKGIKQSLIHQSLKSLESFGLVIENTATVKDVDQSHFVTDYGSDFITFCTDIDKGTASSIDLEKL
ncbi:MAG TPA: hypothetical protein VF209_02120 [Patescibacteria group bacterium]